MSLQGSSRQLGKVDGVAYGPMLPVYRGNMSSPTKSLAYLVLKLDEQLAEEISRNLNRPIGFFGSRTTMKVGSVLQLRILAFSLAEGHPPHANHPGPGVDFGDRKQSWISFGDAYPGRECRKSYCDRRYCRCLDQ